MKCAGCHNPTEDLRQHILSVFDILKMFRVVHKIRRMVCFDVVFKNIASIILLNHLFNVIFSTFIQFFKKIINPTLKKFYKN